MDVLKIEKGRMLLKSDKIKALYIIVQGSIRVSTDNDSWILEAGNIIGIMECVSANLLCSYQAVEDTMCYVFSYKQSDDFKQIFAKDIKFKGIFTLGAAKQTTFLIKKYKINLNIENRNYKFLMEMLESYQKIGLLCGITEDIFEKVEFSKKLSLEEHIQEWTLEYYEGLANLPMQTFESFFGSDDSIAIGFILNTGFWMEKSIQLNQAICSYINMQKEFICGEKENSLINLYFKIAKIGASKKIDLDYVRRDVLKIIDFSKEQRLYNEDYLKQILEKFEKLCLALSNLYQTEAEESVQEDLGMEIQEEEKGNYLQQILDYAGYANEKTSDFKSKLEEYLNLPDMLSTEDEIRKLRKILSQHYYNIYLLSFKKAVKEHYIPKAVQMLLNFGFMDERLTGTDIADNLFETIDKLNLCNSERIYTMFEWLKSIYEGKNEPSRNEFDLDYQAFLLELRKTKEITLEQEKALNRDTWKKVEYEIKNMFVSNNRATYGKLSTFCPILCEHDIINSIDHMLITAPKLNDALEKIKHIDFSAFYREVIFSDPDKNVLRELVQKEVMPQIILIPNAGSKAMMWQENVGAKKDTPARFMVPILTITDVEELMLELVGRYRWEICRKIQGARWNDVSERSLTSEYSDYIQYYRKNNNLSPDAKEKVKNAMAKAKNNFREVFVIDYKNWVRYESRGSFRLNKVSRDILFRYCPFIKEIRNDLIINPMYRELFEKYEILNQRKQKQVEIFIDRYVKKGGEITAELQVNKDFYDM